ncbi:MAG: hypothetical protein CMJ75_07630 [Planctomycetaceae bacterium]|nr:hypothetical protein [Planctomycetaceae bacterium]
MSHKINPVIYILIELAERELDSKLLTALFLIKKGFHVVLGQHWSLTVNKDCLPAGVFFFKGMNKIQTDSMARVRRFGHIVVAMEEELLNYCDYPPEYYDFRDFFHTDASHHCQLFLATHDFEFKVVKQIMPNLNVRLTGNPRTDLLRPELSSMYNPIREKITKRMSSNYILINTNLGALNSRVSSKLLSDTEKRVASKEKEWIKRYEERKNAHIKWEACDMESTFKLIEIFGQYSPDRKVVIRPHPVEKEDTYTKFSRKYPNIAVVSNQNSVRPWILASDILIHTGCTTGSEAVAMNHPAISIQERGSELVQFRTTNHVSYLTHTAEEAYQAVQNYYAGELDFRDTSKLKEFWTAQEGEFAAERMANEIYDFYLGIGGLFADFELSFSNPFKVVRLTEFYRRKMFVEFAQIKHSLKQIYQQLPTMPRQMKLREICRNVFYMYPP